MPQLTDKRQKNSKTTSHTAALSKISAQNAANNTAKRYRVI
jgi:hypothetical protein